MIEILSPKGNVYNINERTAEVFRDGVLLPKAQAEVAYCGNDEDSIPTIVGIFLRDRGEILTKLGNMKKVVDINTIK